MPGPSALPSREPSQSRSPVKGRRSAPVGQTDKPPSTPSPNREKGSTTYISCPAPWLRGAIPMKPWTLVLIALVAAGSLSGCMGHSDGKKQFTVPSDAPATAQQVAPDEAYKLTIHVVFETEANPIQGAGVVVFETTETVDGDGVFFDWTSISYEPIAAARSDANGTVVAYLAPGREVNVVAGDVTHNTTEVRMSLVTGAKGTEGSVTIPLYCDSLGFGGSGSFPLTATGRAGTESESAPFTFSSDAAVNAAYLERIQTLQGTLGWSSGPGGVGDLYAGVAAGSAAPFAVGTDGMDLPHEASHEEDVSVDGDGFEAQREAVMANGLSFVALTDNYALSVNGLSFTFEGSATFEASTFVIHG